MKYTNFTLEKKQCPLPWTGNESCMAMYALSVLSHHIVIESRTEQIKKCIWKFLGYPAPSAFACLGFCGF